MTAFSDETVRDWLPLKYEDGPDFCTVTFATGAAFALTVHPERMKLMEAALSASPVGEPALRMCGYCKTWNSKPCGEQCYLQPSDPVWTAPVAQEPVACPTMREVLEAIAVELEEHRRLVSNPMLTAKTIRMALSSPPATPAGLGADEIARIKDAASQLMRSYYEARGGHMIDGPTATAELARKKIKDECDAILALLSRGSGER